jgi:hypothetical protein
MTTTNWISELTEKCYKQVAANNCAEASEKETLDGVTTMLSLNAVQSEWLQARRQYASCCCMKDCQDYL